MKSQRTPYLLTLTLIMILTVGCRQIAVITTTPSSPTPILPTNTATMTPTSTTIPTITTATVPILPVEQARTKLLDLLANNGNCFLPCLWGITPGKTTYQEARGILEPLSAISDITEFKLDSGAIFPRFTESDYIFTTAVGFLSDDQVVNHIALQAQVLNETQSGTGQAFDATLMSKRFGAYTLPFILSRQGIPAAVVLSTLATPPTRGGIIGFDMLLLYPDQGILIHYAMVWQASSGTVYGCPSNTQEIELELFPSGNGAYFSELLSQTVWKNMWPVPNNQYWKPIDVATPMTLEEFYRTFSQLTDRCIETPAKIWPVPEP